MTSPFQLISDTVVRRTSDGAYIPIDPMNTDYQFYQAWVDGGGVPDPAPTAPHQPKHPLRALADLMIAKGFLTQVEVDAINADTAGAFEQSFEQSGV